MASALRKIGIAIARRTTRAQRLPLRVDDPRTVDALAEMLGPPRRVRSSRKAAAR
jgi:hypothetical protein